MEGDSEAKSTFKLAAELFGIVAIYLYFGGWVYASDILSNFGLSIGISELPVYYFIVYAYSVFFPSVWGWLLLLAIGSSWYALARVRFVKWAEIIVALAIAILPFPVCREALATLRLFRQAAEAATLTGALARKLLADLQTKNRSPVEAVIG